MCAGTGGERVPVASVINVDLHTQIDIHYLLIHEANTGSIHAIVVVLEFFEGGCWKNLEKSGSL